MLDAVKIAECFADLEYRQAEADFKAALWKPFEGELQNGRKSGYAAFQKQRDAFIGILGRIAREKCSTARLDKIWTVLVYGSDEQAHVLLSGTAKQRKKLLESAFHEGWFRSERGSLVQVPVQ